MERDFRPDVVFTVFGPAYVRFETTHVCGFADPWVTHLSRVAIQALPWRPRQWTRVITARKKLFLSPEDYYCVEAPVAQRGLQRILGIPAGRIRVIPNSFSDVFEQAEQPGARWPGEKDVIRLFTLANPYPHKNLVIIPPMITELRRLDPRREYRFIVTVPEGSDEAHRFWSVADRYETRTRIENAGKLLLQDCPAWYAKSDIVFMPTLLETFSATYPEAMKMKRPIVTTDLDFAHDICGDAALYYTPLSAEHAARQIQRLVADRELYEELVRRGQARVGSFPSPEEKYRMQIAWLEEVAARGRG